MPEDVKEEIEEVVQQTNQKIATQDVCETPSPPAEEVPIPYPNTSSSNDTTSGSKNVKIQGKEIMTKESNYEKSSGDEPGKSNSGNVSKIIETVKKTKLLNIPILVWGFTVIILVALIWILTLNGPQPAEHLEQVIQFLMF